MLSSRLRYQNYGTAGPRSLMSAQGGRNMERSAFYLGNVGIEPTKYEGVYFGFKDIP